MKVWAVKKGNKYFSWEFKFGSSIGEFDSLDSAVFSKTKKDAKKLLVRPKETGEHLVQVEIKEIL